MAGNDRGRFPREALLFWAAVVLLLAPVRAAAAEAIPVVGSVSFQVASPYRISYEELMSLVTVRPGELLTGQAIRDSIRGLYGKGSFREVAAYARESGGKADVLFALQPAPLVAELEVRGAGKVGASQIVSASRIRRGSPLGGKAFGDAEKAIRELLRKKGFNEASVTVRALCSVESGSGKVVIDVREGKPGVIRSVEFPGASFFAPGQVADIAGVSPGERFDFRRWEKGVRRLRRAYKEKGFLTVRIGDAETACESREGVCLRVLIEEGPRYDVVWEGARRYSNRRLVAASGIGGDEEATEGALVHDVRERLLAFYRGRDFLQADVRVEAGGEASGPRFIRIAVTEGVKGYLREIRFEGNKSLPSSRLVKQMVTKARGPFRLLTGSGTYGEEAWNEDLRAIVGLYQKEGYARARIVAVDTAWDGRGGMTKTIRIEEGPRFRVGDIVFRGNDHFLKAELLHLLGNRAGPTIDYAGLDRDRDAVAEFYRNAGYLDVRVEASVAFDEALATAVIRFEIGEGPRYRLGNVIVRGNVLTDPVVVLREITIPKGEPAGENRIIKFQQAVYRTGLYKTVRVQRVKRPAEETLDLVVEVEETLFFRIEFGAGYGTDTGVRGFVGAESANLDGRGRRLGGRIQLSQKEQVYLARLREPWILGNRWKWDGILTLSYSVTEKESFSLRKTSTVAGISKEIFTRSSVAVQYELSREDTFNVSPGAILSPADQGTASIATVSGLFALDFRDDPFNPKRGSFNSASTEFAVRMLGSEVEYTKIAAQSSWYLPVFRRNTFVVSGRAGFAFPYGETLEIPIQRRFFLGGRTTVRGFKEDMLGPLGTDGKPIGGDTMVNANVEFRIPLGYDFLAASFFDAGSVWIRGKPQFAFDLRESAGIGLRYVTPIGPLAVDYGWKLDRREGESPGAFHFTVGAVF